MAGYFMQPKRSRFDTEDGGAKMIQPRFDERLQTKEVKEGASVRFTVRVSGKPPPEVTWYREGSQIVSSADFEIKQEGDLHTLFIPEAFYEDSGKFSVIASSKAGQVECTAELIVEAPSAVEESLSPTPPVSRSPSIPKRTPFSGSSREPSPPRKILPHFLKTLANQNAREGQRVTLECSVAAYPPVEKVQWFRNELEIFTSPDYEITFSLGRCALTIAEAFPEDSGKYACTVVVGGVPNTTTMFLRVDAAPKPVVAPQPERTPTFEIGLTNQCLYHGGTAYFECKVKGYPPPEILWTRRGHPLVDKTRYKSTYDQYSGTTTLTIMMLKPEDEGEYTCKAINSAGEVSTSATLLSQDRFSDWQRQQTGRPTPTKQPMEPAVGVIDETSYVEPDALKRMMKSPSDRTGSRDRESGGVSEKYFKPVFRKVPTDIEVTEGQMARFDCIVTGRPHPDMHWYRDGQEVFDDRLHKIVINEDGINSLIFDVTSRADAGQYTCIARNRAGEDRFQVHLNILARQATAPPKFIDRLANQTVAEGYPVTFDAEVVGVPVPMMSWQKDGKMLSSDDHYNIRTDGGRSSLYIPAARPDDNAWFQCTAASIAGQATNRARLIVQVEARQATPERKLSFPRKVATAPAKEVSQVHYQPRPVSEPQKPIGSPQMDRRRVTTPVHLGRAGPSPTPESHRSHADIILSPTPPPMAPTYRPMDFARAPQPAPPPQPSLTPVSPVVATIDSRVKAPVQRQLPAPAKPSEIMKFIEDDDRMKPKPRDQLDGERYAGDMEPGRMRTVEPPAEDMFHKDQHRPPKFKTQIKPKLDLMENDPAHFECRLVPIGDPDMKVEWFKDGVLLKHGHRFRPMYDFGYVALEILYVYPEDTGMYMCKATNKYGSDTTLSRIQCYGKESVIYDTQLPEGIESVRHIQEMEDLINSDQFRIPREEELPDRTPPVFDLVADVANVEEGDTAKFMVKVSGNPRPRLTWWVNGAIVVNSQRFRLRYDGMIHILEIPKVRDYDSGTIRIVAKNPLGEAECSSSLNVSARDDWRSRLKQAPKSTVEVELDKKKHAELRSFELDQAKKKKVPTATLR